MSGEITYQIQLRGQPSLEDYLDFVHDRVVDGDTKNRSELVDDWRRANDYYEVLEEREAEIASDIEVFKLDPSLQPIIDEVKQDPHYNYTFDKLPTNIAMVELDRMVIYQTHIDREFSESLQAKLGKNPDPATLFRFCMPPESSDDIVQARRMGSNRYVFSSESTDFRAHVPTLLSPEQIGGFNTFGPLSGMVGLGVGFGSNFFTGILAEERVLLHNGYHRAHAMRALGITHAPCILQTTTRMDELEIAAKSVVLDDPNFYFGSARPPLLKDFFDPNIAHEFPVYKTKKMIEICFDMKSYHVRL